MYTIITLFGNNTGTVIMKRVMGFLRDTLFSVARDKQGSISTFIAAAAIPLVAFSGLAVDTARGYLMKSRLNHALDSAALAGGQGHVRRDGARRCDR